MHRKFTFVFLMIFTVFSSHSQPPTEEKMNIARTHFNNGVKMGIDEDFEQAIEEFEKAIELNPLFAEAFLYKGLAEIELQNFDQAIKDFTITIELDPAFSDQAHYFRGLTRYFKNENQSAIDDFTVAIRMNPDFVSFYQRGKANLKLKEFRRALQDFDIALRLKEDFYEANLYRGINLYYLEMYEAALQDLDIATRQLPHNADGHYYSGLTRLAINNKTDGIENLERALELDPGFIQAAEAREEALASITPLTPANSRRENSSARLAESVSEPEPGSQSPVVNRKVESTDIDFSELFSASQSKEETPEATAVPVSYATVEEPQVNENNDFSEIANETTPAEIITPATSFSSEPVNNSIEQVQPGIYNHSLEKRPVNGFGVQVASYSNTDNLLSLADAYSQKYSLPVFFNIADVNGRKLYKLIIGQFSTREEAENFRDVLRNESFPDSFLIVFENL
jgi:tetratricopeptide (TPR) repeat protein